MYVQFLPFQTFRSDLPVLQQPCELFLERAGANISGLCSLALSNRSRRCARRSQVIVPSQRP